MYEVINMKKTAIILSAIVTGAMALPTAANAKYEYPIYPTRPTDAVDFSGLPEDVVNAYLVELEAYREDLCTAYLNGEYDWDFNLDGEINVIDTHYPSIYYGEKSLGMKQDEHGLKILNDGKDWLTVSFTGEMREKLEEYGDINGDGFIDTNDGSEMLGAFYRAKQQGDVNTDGMVDSRDASKMLAFYSANSVNIESDYITEKNMEYLGDLNGDGKVDSADASYALAEYSKLATE